MTNRAGIACIAAAVAGAALFPTTGVPLDAQAGASVIQVADLADMALGPFHNGLFRSPADHIVEDRGVRMGSLGSDLFHDPGESYNEFWTVTDRGPNGNPGRRTFLAPKFDPLILHVRVQDNRVLILDAMPILDSSGRPVTGLPNVPGFDEVPYDFNGTNIIDANPNGLDTEGIVRTRAGRFWLVDEYSPSLVSVNTDGRVIERFVPAGSELNTTIASTPNYPVKKYLPAILNKRRQNRGFEGIAFTSDETTLFLGMQSPLDYPTNAIGRASRNVRILKFDTATERVTAEYVYHVDEVCAFLGQATGCGVAPGEMKLSGLIAVSPTVLLVEERTDTLAKVYRVDLSRATNILGTVWDDVAAAPTAGTASLEGLATPATQGITVLPKTLLVNLGSFSGMPGKIEGIALAKADVLAVVNDNDFGLADNVTFDSHGKLSNDTQAKSQVLFIQLPAAVK